MSESIIKLREKLVSLSTDPIETRKLLDKLTEEEIDAEKYRSHFHVGEKDILESKDFGHYVVHRTTNGYLIHYHGGYSVLVDEKMHVAASALEMLMTGVPEEITDENERQGYSAAISAIEMVFRLPMFVFSNNEVTYSLAEIGILYMINLQKIGEIPTAEKENPEFDSFIIKMNELVENLANGLEKEYNNLNTIGYGEETFQSKSESKNEGESKAEA